MICNLTVAGPFQLSRRFIYFDKNHHNSNRGCFTGPIYTQESEDFTLIHGEGDIIDRGKISELFS